jgi:hypothetical protein
VPSLLPHLPGACSSPGCPRNISWANRYPPLPAKGGNGSHRKTTEYDTPSRASKQPSTLRAVPQINFMTDLGNRYFSALNQRSAKSQSLSKLRHSPGCDLVWPAPQGDNESHDSRYQVRLRAVYITSILTQRFPTKNLCTRCFYRQKKKSAAKLRRFYHQHAVQFRPEILPVPTGVTFFARQYSCDRHPW